MLHVDALNTASITYAALTAVLDEVILSYAQPITPAEDVPRRHDLEDEQRSDPEEMQ
jgi:hypothetical protein